MTLQLLHCEFPYSFPSFLSVHQAESKENHGEWEPNAGVDYNLTPESTRTHLLWATLCQSRLSPPVGAFGLASRYHDYRKENIHTVLEEFILFRCHQFGYIPPPPPL